MLTVSSNSSWNFGLVVKLNWKFETYLTIKLSRAEEVNLAKYSHNLDEIRIKLDYFRQMKLYWTQMSIFLHINWHLKSLIDWLKKFKFNAISKYFIFRFYLRQVFETHFVTCILKMIIQNTKKALLDMSCYMLNELLD